MTRAGKAFILSAGTLTALALAAVAQDSTLSGAFDGAEPMGWDRPLPPTAPGAGGELEALSNSASGVSFGAEIYDAVVDNPLKPVAVRLRALDKITATYQDIEIPIGTEASFGPLTLLPRTCDKRPPEETPETTVFLEVLSNTNDVAGERLRVARGGAPATETSIRLPGETVAGDASRPTVFKGWMFASSPSLNALEHPVYDVWVIDCKMVDPRA